MQVASNRLEGAMTSEPDVCLTPLGLVIVPVPYINVALTMTAVEFSPIVVLSGGNALTEGSILALSMGDEPGVAHWTIKGPAAFLLGAPKVVIEGLPAVTLCSIGISNLGNSELGLVDIPSVTNSVFMLAPENPHDAQKVDWGDLLQLREKLDRKGVCGDPDGQGLLLPGGVGWLGIQLFSSRVPSQVYGAVRGLLAQGMTTLVLDLRDNPGGDVHAALDLAGDFLEAGTIVASLRDKDGDLTTYRARSTAPYLFPLILLVNGGTASAAELFAGCLKAHGRALVMGERTFGKGTACMLGARSDGEGLEFRVVGELVLPSGDTVDGLGIDPDIERAA